MLQFVERNSMFEKDGKFYADWRDRSGKRKRKSFTSKRAGLRFEEEMKEQAHPKKKTLGRPSPRYLASKSDSGKKNTTVSASALPKDSSRLQVVAGRGNFVKVKLRK
jgi:hypothetical protein